MSTREWPEINETAHLVRARKTRRCEGYRCPHQIDPGEDYVRTVCFPGHDANGGTRPWVLHLCITCATEYDRPLPPRRSTNPTDEGAS